jgi:type IV pilus assembly protein PilA
MIRHNLNGRARRGFTLVELLVVIVVLGILASIAVPVFLNQRVAAWKATVVSDVHNAAGQVELASQDAGGSVSDIHTAADTTTEDTIKYTRSNANADGVLTRSMMIGSQKITISPGNKITLTVFTNNKYRIVGEQPANLKGWQYVYESDKGTGKWVSPAAGDDDIGVRAVMYTESDSVPVYRLATDDETAKINAALANGSATLPTADGDSFPAGRLSSWDAAHFIANASIFDLIIKDGSRYYLGGNNPHYVDTVIWGTKLSIDPTTKDYTYNTPLDYVNNSSYDHEGYPDDIKVPAIQNVDTINDTIRSASNYVNIMKKTTADNAPLAISDNGKKVNVSCYQSWDKSITVKNMSTMKAHTLTIDYDYPDETDETVTLQPGETKVISLDESKTVSDDTGFTLSINININSAD